MARQVERVEAEASLVEERRRRYRFVGRFGTVPYPHPICQGVNGDGTSSESDRCGMYKTWGTSSPVGRRRVMYVQGGRMGEPLNGSPACSPGLRWRIGSAAAHKQAQFSGRRAKVSDVSVKESLYLRFAATIGFCFSVLLGARETRGS